MIRRYRAEDGCCGFSAGDVLLPDVGPRLRAVATGAGVQVEQLPADAGSACDRCGEFVADIDVHGLGHDCGGTWSAIGAEVGHG